MTEPHSSYGFRAFLPLPKEQRKGIALCLSGGGYRASLFHLGALLRLDELGVLSRIDTITSVSGGSVTAGMVAADVVRRPDVWARGTGRVEGFEEAVAEPLRALSRRDIRTGPILDRLWPTSWFNQNAAAEELAERYVEGTIEGKISDLAGHRPRFVFCATDMQFRTQWVFDTGRQVVGHDVAGYAAPSDRWTIAEAAAASSCFPTVFSPVRVDDRLVGGSYGGPDAERLLADVELSDGGIYDNLGLEPVWRDHAVVLVSDAAPSLSVDPQLGALWHGLRYIVTLLEQATDVRKRWLISSFARGDLAGTYWGIAGDPGAYGYDGPGRPYSHELIRDVISQVRIDFDVFSDAERGVLENHGYLMAEVAVGRHAKDLVAPDAPPPDPPHPDWMDDAEVRSALATSSRTRILGRRFARARRRRR